MVSQQNWCTVQAASSAASSVLAHFERVPVTLEVAAAGASEDEMAAVAGSNSPLRRLLWLLGFNSSEAVNIRAATRLYDAICAQTDTHALHDSVQMVPVFYSRWCGRNSRSIHSRTRCSASVSFHLRPEDWRPANVHVRIGQARAACGPHPMLDQQATSRRS